MKLLISNKWEALWGVWLKFGQMIQQQSGGWSLFKSLSLLFPQVMNRKLRILIYILSTIAI